MKKSFITVTPDNGNNNESLSVTADANSGNARETSISIEGGGISKSVVVNQAAGTLKGKGIKFILNGAVFGGLIDSDAVNNDGVRNILINLDTIIEAGSTLVSQYNAHIGINWIDNHLATQDELPTFNEIRYAGSSEKYSIVKDTNLPANVYGPANTSQKINICKIMKAFLLEDGINKTLILTASNGKTVLTIRALQNIQVINIGMKMFIGMPYDTSGQTIGRAFAIYGESLYDNPVNIAFRREGIQAMGGLTLITVNNSDTLNINSFPTTISALCAIFTITDSQIQSKLAQYADAGAAGQNIRIMTQFQSGVDTITLTNRVVW
jgi:hypothetical protein